MFALASLPEIHDELVKKQSKCDEMSKQLDEKKEFLLKCSKEQEDNLRELVQQRKEAGSNWSGFNVIYAKNLTNNLFFNNFNQQLIRLFISFANENNWEK